MAGRTYTIPEHVWRECICIIRDYDRAKEEYESLLCESAAAPNGMPKAKSPSSPTERIAIRRAQMSIRLCAVEEAFTVIPTEYRQAIWDNIVNRSDYPIYTHRSTFVRWKRRMIKCLAERLLLI